MAFRFVLEPILDDRGMTPEQLSETTGISMETISSMCDGSAKEFMLKELEAVCEALGCNPADIIKNMKGDWHTINIKTGEITPTNAFDI